MPMTKCASCVYLVGRRGTGVECRRHAIAPREQHPDGWPVVTLDHGPATIPERFGCGEGEERVPSADPTWRTTPIPDGMHVEFLAADGTTIPGIRGDNSPEGWRLLPNFDDERHGRKLGVLVWRPEQLKAGKELA